jgi:hypothetical protein
MPLNSQWEEKSRTLGDAFTVLQNNSTVDKTDDVKELIDTKILMHQAEKSAVGFVSEDVHHQVMSYFVLNCLNTIQDYTNYITLSSVDSLLEYVRPWGYKRDKYERCLYLPEELEEVFIRRLGIDALRHVMIVDPQDTDRERNKGKYGVIRDNDEEIERKEKYGAIIAKVKANRKLLSVGLQSCKFKSNC